MPLQIGGSGSGKPFIKYNAKADKWFVRGAAGEDAEIPRPTFVIDLENIATGWLLFREGQAPERVMDPSIDQPAPSPGEGFKRGFVVIGFSPKFFGGIAEFAGTSVHLSNAIKDVYAQYEADKANHRGELPVVSCTGSEAMKDRYGVNYRPIFQIVKWVQRPKELPSQSPVDTADVWTGANRSTPASAKTPAQHVPPPAPAPKPATAAADPLSEAVF
jgi:hypothetical protein